MEAKPRPAPPRDARTLPARYYTDTDLFDREMERIFGRMWISAGRVDEVAEPGSYVTRIVGRGGGGGAPSKEESVIIVRDRQNRLRAFFNVCRHRGTRICTSTEGRFADTIQCPYHAWTYGLDGRLLGAPHMDNVPDFDRGAYPLHPVALDEWDGHIFLNLDGGRSGTLRKQLATLPAKFRPWRMEELRLGKRIVYDVRANWKLIIQNYSECLHCPVIHPALNRLSHYLSGENEPAHPAYIGGRMDLRPGFETFSTDGLRRRACLPGLAAEDCSRIYFYAVLPNLLLSPHPDYVMTQTLWPRACDRTEIVSEWHFHPDEMSRPDFILDDVIAFWDETNRQDWHVSELSQLGISSRVYSPGPYSDREDLLYQFDRMIVDILS
jgi:Rieske 2Fe-2S family protein